MVFIGVLTGIILWIGNVVPGWIAILIIVGVVLLGRAGNKERREK